SPRLAWPVTTFCGTPAAFVVTSATLAARRCSPVDAACGAPVAGVAVEAAGGIAAAEPSKYETPRQVRCCVVCLIVCCKCGSKRHFCLPVTASRAMTRLCGVQT